MGRRSNATLARLNNLPRPVNLLENTTVEEVSDDEDTDFEENVKNSLDDVPIVQIQR